jgi:hypothetical protein
MFEFAFLNFCSVSYTTQRSRLDILVTKITKVEKEEESKAMKELKEARKNMEQEKSKP